MNLFNKIVVILLLLTIMIVVPLALIFPEQLEIFLRTSADLVGANVDWLLGLTPTGQIGMRLLFAAGGLLVFLVGLVLIVLQFVRFRRRGTIKLRDGSGELTTAGISQHLAYYIDMLPDVSQVKPVVESSSKGVRVTLNVEIAPGIDALQKSHQVRQTARRVIEDQLGVEVRDEIRVVLKPSSFPKLAAGAQMPPVVAEAIAETPAPQPAPVPETVIAPAPAPETVVAEVAWDKKAEAAEAELDLFAKEGDSAKDTEENTEDETNRS